MTGRQRVSAAAMALACLVAQLPVPAVAAGLPENIQKLIDSSPAARTAFWGIQIVDLATGKTLYERNSEHYFVPASNAKLFSTALALTRLGPDFTFQTRVLAAGPPDAQGRIAGDLRLAGGGDPNLSARAIPYRMGPSSGNPLAAIEDLADQLVARGIRSVAGDIVGDDTWYVWQPYATGWAIDDPQSDDGPPISALTVADNVLTLSVRPGAAAGEVATLSLNPPSEFYRIENRVRTIAAGGERRIHFRRIPGSRDALLWGAIPLRDRGQELLISVEDPAEFAAQALRSALEARGVTVYGGARAEHLMPDGPGDLTQAPPPEPNAGVELAHHLSARLIEDLRVTAKVSQNLHAELALRAVGRARRNVGSFEAGMEEMKAFLTEVGVDPAGYNLLDGSGLSRLDLITPATAVKLLRYMYDSPARESWLSILPVGGQDGTLSTRFGGTAGAGRVYAKTGSLSHVSALSGYIQRADGNWVAFSILVNNYGGRGAAEVRGVMDRICNLVLE
jgi:D-alanyl-D-alanine carboxypeptidase/D-alanyl-D-alanine-endopeptidase (penicillin-binding protein 4)